MWIKDRVDTIVKSCKEKYLLENASKLDIVDIKNLCIGINNIPRVDFVATNASYGHAYHLKMFAGIDPDTALNCVIAHGMYLTRSSRCEIELSHLVSSMLTCSEFDKNVIEGMINLNVIPIGPMIAYVQDYCTEEELRKRKEENGKTLLVFPTHGIQNADIVYDMELFCSEIDEVSKSFDTVMICLHYCDVRAGIDKFYKEKGYTVVCAGVGTDINFLKRQKMILQLSDAVIGNSFTTGLANALYFDKPVYIFKQQIAYNNKSLNNFTQLDVDMTLINEFFNLSSDNGFGNLEKQKQWGNYYFGLDKVKTRDELFELLNSVTRK